MPKHEGDGDSPNQVGTGFGSFKGVFPPGLSPILPDRPPDLRSSRIGDRSGGRPERAGGVSRILTLAGVTMTLRLGWVLGN